MGARPLTTLPQRTAGRARRLVAACRERVVTRGFRRQAAELASGHPAEYRAYLETQLERSVRRRANDPGVGQQILVAAAAAAAPPGAAVLCIGCRNGRELDAFRAQGFDDVRGIDIFSQRADILVMDMHSLAFPDATFDVVYSAHALEHAHDVDQVAGEALRVVREGGTVAVEVPVRHKGSTADVVVFEGIDSLSVLFEGAIGEVLLREEAGPRSERNDQGSDIARLVFRVRRSLSV